MQFILIHSKCDRLTKEKDSRLPRERSRTQERNGIRLIKDEGGTEERTGDRSFPRTAERRVQLQGDSGTAGSEMYPTMQSLTYFCADHVCCQS